MAAAQSAAAWARVFAEAVANIKAARPRKRRLINIERFPNM